MIRPVLLAMWRPFLRELSKVRNRRKIARAPEPLASEMTERRKERILLLAWYDPEGLQTHADHARTLGRYSRFRWDLMNLYGYETGRGLVIPPGARLGDYDAVFVHGTAAYNSENVAGFLGDLAAYSGVKVMMKQDEHFRTNRIVESLRDGGFDLLLTCVPPDEVHKVYPREKLPRLELLHCLTGYVTDELRALSCPPTTERPIDIGYRGSPQPYTFGQLAYEKRQIAEVFERVCAERGLVADIKFGWGDRFMGRAWFDFLGRSKGTLGSESGGSVFDFDGEVERVVKAHLRKNRAATFEEVSERFLKPHEGNVRYAQIAPRHFEAAACKTVQILYEGRYSDIFVPWRHFLPLKRDLSNLDEVMKKFLDPAERTRITDAAYEEIVLNDKHHYRGFVGELDAAISRAFAARSR